MIGSRPFAACPSQRIRAVGTATRSGPAHDRITPPGGRAQPGIGTYDRTT